MEGNQSTMMTHSMSRVDRSVLCSEQDLGEPGKPPSSLASSLIRHPTRVGFLFNHDHLHQIPHGAPIVTALCNSTSSLEIHVFVTGKEQARFLRHLLPSEILDRIDWHELKSPLFARTIDWLFGHAVPFERLGILFRYQKNFASMDALVVPETTSLFLKRGLGCRNLKLIYTQHGAGDRAVGFKAAIRHFDHVLVPGPKIRDRMLDEGIARPGGYSEVGYPKFDAIHPDAPPRLFANDNPVVLYNPHCHPGLSSWFRDGLKVLEFFRTHPDFNLIFAPHVMLFAKRAHLSTDPWHLKWRGEIPARYFSAPNIRIDTGGPACVDMTYTRAADIYLGDVSSQIYEFLQKPRPALFLNSHGADWEEDPNYAHWHLGPVIKDVAALSPWLANRGWHSERFAAPQARAFEATFGTPIQGGGRRAAEAIQQCVLASLRTHLREKAPCVQ